MYFDCQSCARRTHDSAHTTVTFKDLGADFWLKCLMPVRFADAILAPSPSRAVKSQPPQSLGRARLPHELRDGNADLVGAVLLDEMHSTDGGLGQVRPGADEVADAAVDDGAWVGIDEQFGHIAFGQPAAVVVDHRRDVGGLAVDWDVAWSGQRWPAGFACFDERLPVVVHFLSLSWRCIPAGSTASMKVFCSSTICSPRGDRKPSNTPRMSGGIPTRSSG